MFLLKWKKITNTKITKIQNAPIPSFPLYSGCKKYLQKSPYQYGKNTTNIKIIKIHSASIPNFPLYSGCKIYLQNTSTKMVRNYQYKNY